MSIVVLPILFFTLYEKDGLPFEKHLSYILQFHRNKKIRVYKARSIYHTEKEKDIEKSNKVKNKTIYIANAKPKNTKRRDKIGKR